MLTVVVSAVSAFGLHIFVFGNSFAPSGIDGIATMLQEMTKINAGLFTLILNLPLLIAAWFILKRKYVISFVCYIKSAYSTIIGAFGKVDILINGAGGNNPKAACDNETMSPEMLGTDGLKDFFALDESGRIQLHRMACRSLCAVQYSLQRNCARVLRDKPEPRAFV